MRGVPQLHYFVISMGGCPAVGAAAGVGIIGDIGSRPSMDIHGLGPWAVGSTCCHDFFTGTPGLEISALAIVKGGRRTVSISRRLPRIGLPARALVLCHVNTATTLALSIRVACDAFSRLGLFVPNFMYYYRLLTHVYLHYLVLPPTVCHPHVYRLTHKSCR